MRREREGEKRRGKRGEGGGGDVRKEETKNQMSKIKMSLASLCQFQRIQGHKEAYKVHLHTVCEHPNRGQAENPFTIFSSSETHAVKSCSGDAQTYRYDQQPVKDEIKGSGIRVKLGKMESRIELRLHAKAKTVSEHHNLRSYAPLDPTAEDELGLR